MEKSAGIAIVYKKEKILLIHPTGSSWKNNLSIPKGKIEKGEKRVSAAIRETFEEVGINIPLNLISEEGPVIKYEKKGQVYKIVYTFIVHIDDLSTINLKDEEIKKTQLALDEVNWAGFVNKNDLKDKGFLRFNPLFEYVFGGF